MNDLVHFSVPCPKCGKEWSQNFVRADLQCRLLVDTPIKVWCYDCDEAVVLTSGQRQRLGQILEEKTGNR